MIIYNILINTCIYKVTCVYIYIDIYLVAQDNDENEFVSNWGKTIDFRWANFKPNKDPNQKSKNSQNQKPTTNRSLGSGRRWTLKPSTSNGKTKGFFTLHLRSPSSAPGGGGGTFQLSPVQPMKLEGALEEGGRSPVPEKNRTPQYQHKSFAKSFTPITKKCFAPDRETHIVLSVGPNH